MHFAFNAMVHNLCITTMDATNASENEIATQSNREMRQVKKIYYFTNRNLKSLTFFSLILPPRLLTHCVYAAFNIVHSMNAQKMAGFKLNKCYAFWECSSIVHKIKTFLFFICCNSFFPHFRP